MSVHQAIQTIQCACNSNKERESSGNAGKECSPSAKKESKPKVPKHLRKKKPPTNGYSYFIRECMRDAEMMKGVENTRKMNLISQKWKELSGKLSRICVHRGELDLICLTAYYFFFYALFFFKDQLIFSEAGMSLIFANSRLKCL